MEVSSAVYYNRKVMNSSMVVKIICCLVFQNVSTSLQKVKGKGKAVLLQAWSGPEGSRKLRFPDFVTAQDGGKVVSLTHRPPLPQEILLVLIYIRG